MLKQLAFAILATAALGAAAVSTASADGTGWACRGCGFSNGTQLTGVVPCGASAGTVSAVILPPGKIAE